MVKSMLAGLEWFSAQYRKVLLPLLVLLSSVLTIVVLYGVFMRYVMNNSPSWTEEAARYLMVWSALIAMSIALRQNRHIGLTSLVERLWGKYTNTAFFFADIAMLIFFIVMLVTGINMAIFVTNQRSPSMNLPMWIPYLSIPVGGFFLSVETIILLLKKLVRS
jgi:TRAP-type C4-dicarboxylate transport system permease small subunit